MIKNLFKDQTDNILIQMFRYTLVGGFAFIIDFSSLAVFIKLLNVHYLIAAGMSFLLGVTVNYILSVIWIFNKKKLKNRQYEFGIFAIIGVIGLGFNETFIWFFTESFHIDPLISKIASTFFVYFWNFLARKYVLFSPETWKIISQRISPKNS